MSAAFDLDTAIFVSQLAAAVVTICLIALQTDFISRKILSPLRLYAKRRQDQLYKLDNSIADSILRIRTHINQGNNFESKIEKHITDVVLDDDSIQQLVDELILHEKKDDGNVQCRSNGTAPLIVGVAKDLTIPKDQLYVYLAYPEPDKDQHQHKFEVNAQFRCNRRVQVPLIPFCTSLASAFEEYRTDYTLCFISDASSSLSSQVFSKLLKDCRTQLGIPIISEPAWMITIALLMRRQAISVQDAELIFFAFCRLEALRLELNNEVGKHYKTIAFILPGQACTKALLPLLQKRFPSERHVFAYHGCVASVQRGLELLKGKRSKMHNTIQELPVMAMPRSTSSVLPLIPIISFVKTLPSLLARLSSQSAGIVEAWMSSVDALITLKQNEGNNFCTPFINRMDFLMEGTDDNGSLEETSFLALSNLLHYITGSGPNALNESILDAAQSALIDLRIQFQKENYPKMTHEQETAIEACVSAYEGIQGGDKILPDTVIPRPFKVST